MRPILPWITLTCARRTLYWFALLGVSLCSAFGSLGAAEKLDSSSAVSKRLDQLMQSHWQSAEIAPAAVCDDATFLRRATLDLAGRIPTADELEQFTASTNRERRQQAIARLLASPEFTIHFADVLDHIVQDERAGDKSFVAYLRRSVQADKPWDAMFREMLVGPWEGDEAKQANRFLDRRARDLDRMTADSARVFFGVDITCARCHDHPLVADWSQEHYYGMAAFFGRTQGGKGKVTEKQEGEVTFQGSDNQPQTARMMFLSGQLVAEDGKNRSTGKTRRDRLVEVGLEQRDFFARSMVNRLWNELFGRGLVDPVDQMHSENPPAIPAVLDLLADDFSEHGYDLRRLVAALVLSDAYQRDSRWTGPGEPPAAEHFAIGKLRPLSPRQYAVSLLLLASPLDAGASPAERSERFAELHRQASEVESAFDPRSPGFESSTAEALYLANSEAVRQLLSPEQGGLADRLTSLESNAALVDAAVESVYGRLPQPAERQRLIDWLKRQDEQRPAAIQRLVWALATSAEFRFNH